MGFDPSGLTEDDRRELDADCRAVLAPASREELAGVVGVLGAMLKSRDGGNFDREAIVASYSRELGDLAGFAVKEACRHIARGSVFFPTLSEIRKEAIKREAPFRVTLSALTDIPRERAGIQSFSRPMMQSETPITDEFYRMHPHLRGRMLRNWPEDLRAEFTARCLKMATGVA